MLAKKAGLSESIFSKDKLGKAGGKGYQRAVNSFETDGFPKAVLYKDKVVALATKKT